MLGRTLVDRVLVEGQASWGEYRGYSRHLD